MRIGSIDVVAFRALLRQLVDNQETARITLLLKNTEGFGQTRLQRFSTDQRLRVTNNKGQLGNGEILKLLIDECGGALGHMNHPEVIEAFDRLRRGTFTIAIDRGRAVHGMYLP